MAWNNIELTIGTGTIINYNLCGATEGFRTIVNNYYATRSELNSMITWNNCYPTIQALNIGDYVIGNSTIGLKLTNRTTDINGVQNYFTLIQNNENTRYSITIGDTTISYPRRQWELCICAAIDEDTQKGCIFFVTCSDYSSPYDNQRLFYIDSTGVDSGGSYPYSLYSRGANNLMYMLLKNSVPQPVGATLKVTYSIPKDTYTYCKLTYKKDERPNDVNDGTSIDISPNSKTVNVEGLDENQLYYFTIFTDKNESESFPFTVQ